MAYICLEKQRGAYIQEKYNITFPKFKITLKIDSSNIKNQASNFKLIIQIMSYAVVYLSMYADIC